MTERSKSLQLKSIDRLGEELLWHLAMLIMSVPMSTMTWTLSKDSCLRNNQKHSKASESIRAGVETRKLRNRITITAQHSTAHRSTPHHTTTQKKNVRTLINECLCHPRCFSEEQGSDCFGGIVPGPEPRPP